MYVIVDLRKAMVIRLVKCQHLQSDVVNSSYFIDGIYITVD